MNTFKSMFINADLGEGCGTDDKLFALVDWANIACGGHTGDAQSMRLACEQALHHGVQVGAHPSYPDREGFGRRKPDMSVGDLLGELCRQVEAFENIASQFGVNPAHIKPHGQLYNDAAVNPDVAELLVRLMQQFPGRRLLALAGSPQVDWSRSAGIDVVEEAFPDRTYTREGRLVPRQFAHALVRDIDQLTRQTLAMANQTTFQSELGEPVVVIAQTLCVHGDSTHAVENAQRVRAVLDHIARGQPI
ncbi:LamB/YcsF family protein [Limnobacter humi]|uniref:LamB/YcsF family protein n=1 Tax=Limnobacter humi TaxID=1778671 RepID=A0ABT1WEE1_9BURK|nr:LamB/YcsF family protein [Limnobacter humi]MCQ8895886.1 LamB/YcsF family protein [Limnobacter humi]